MLNRTILAGVHIKEIFPFWEIAALALVPNLFVQPRCWNLHH